MATIEQALAAYKELGNPEKFASNPIMIEKLSEVIDISKTRIAAGVNSDGGMRKEYSKKKGSYYNSEYGISYSNWAEDVRKPEGLEYTGAARLSFRGNMLSDLKRKNRASNEISFGMEDARQIRKAESNTFRYGQFLPLTQDEQERAKNAILEAEMQIILNTVGNGVQG